MTPDELRYTVAVRLREIEAALVTASPEEAAELATEMAQLSELVDSSDERDGRDETLLRWVARVERSRMIAEKVAGICEQLRDDDLNPGEVADLEDELEQCRDSLDEMT